MSVSMTLDAVRARQKTVTRRHVDSWQHLKAGDRLTLIEKGMGLPKGSKQVVVCEVEITGVRVEQFVDFWMRSHGYGGNLGVDDEGLALAERSRVPVRRIEWRYLDAVRARTLVDDVSADVLGTSALVGGFRP